MQENRNVERINALADLIEKQPHTSFNSETGFCMSHLTHVYDTPACIAGWSAWEALDRPENGIFNPNKRPAYDDWLIGDYMWLEKLAAEYIGYDANHNGNSTDDYPLFYPPFGDYEWITPTIAASVLRHYAATGVVDWDRVKILEAR